METAENKESLLEQAIFLKNKLEELKGVCLKIFDTLYAVELNPLSEKKSSQDVEELSGGIYMTIGSCCLSVTILEEQLLKIKKHL